MASRQRPKGEVSSRDIFSHFRGDHGGKEHRLAVLIFCSVFLLAVSPWWHRESVAQEKGVYHLVKENEDLLTIVDAYMVPRQVLIRHNKLKPPFKVKAGDVLFIPEAPRIIDIPPRRSAASPKGEHTQAPEVAAEKVRVTKLPAAPTRRPITATVLRADVQSQTRNATAAPKKTPSITAPQNATRSRVPITATASPSSIPTTTPTLAGSFIMPVPGEIVAGFGRQSNGMFYNGIRIKTMSKTKVVASNSGVVIYVGELKGYGGTVIIKHANEYATVYTNLGKVTTKLNDAVQKGERIGVAPENREGKAHISFELRHRNNAIDPRKNMKQ